MYQQKNESMNDQGAFLPSAVKFYSPAFNYVKKGDRVLNIGSGGLFIFEKELFHRKKAKIISVDIIENLKKPPFINKLIVQDVEKDFILKEKFDVITCFEVIEHVDKTDAVIKNCYENLKNNGFFIITIPNLASFFCRIELLFGYQPHMLEISNEKGYFGGIFARVNAKRDGTIHHIRGITRKAMIELLNYHKFKVIKEYGYFHKFNLLFKTFLNLAPVNIFICKKT